MGPRARFLACRRPYLARRHPKGSVTGYPGIRRGMGPYTGGTGVNPNPVGENEGLAGGTYEGTTTTPST